MQVTTTIGDKTANEVAKKDFYAEYHYGEIQVGR